MICKKCGSDEFISTVQIDSEIKDVCFLCKDKVCSVVKPQITIRGNSVFLGKHKIAVLYFNTTWVKGNPWSDGKGWSICNKDIISNLSHKVYMRYDTKQAAQEAIIAAVQTWLKKAGLTEAEVKQ